MYYSLKCINSRINSRNSRRKSKKIHGKTQLLKLKGVFHPDINKSRNFLKDVNECTNGFHNCSHNTICKNTNGSYECECNNGYMGNGYQCTGKDSNIRIII